jgi:hypothetical protein
VKRILTAALAGAFALAACSDVTTEPSALAPGSKVFTEHNPDPMLLTGNATCSDVLPGSIEFKIDVNGVPNDVYNDPNSPLVITISNSDGTYFDWESNDIGIDGVVVKGGPDANGYFYDPAATDGQGLHAPINPNNDQPYGLSHASFCYTPSLDVSKTVETEWTRKYNWDIEKTGDKTDLGDVIIPGSSEVNYTVTLSLKDPTDSGWNVSGLITIHNPWPDAATITGVTDAIGFDGLADLNAIVRCPADETLDEITFDHTLPAGGTLVCSYSADLSEAQAAGVEDNTATVTTSGAIQGGSDTKAVAFDTDPTYELDRCVTVSDDKYGPLSPDEVCIDDLDANEEYVYNYKMDVLVGITVCEPGSFKNTATATEEDSKTEHKDDHTVIWDCIPVEFEACTPGFWRNHTELWADPYTPAYLFFTAFPEITNQRGFANSYTLGEAINQGGGQFNRVARHGTAALLSAASGDVAYPYTVQAVIDIVVAAFNSGDHSKVNELAAANEEFDCPL